MMVHQLVGLTIMPINKGIFVFPHSITPGLTYKQIKKPQRHSSVDLKDK